MMRCVLVALVLASCGSPWPQSYTNARTLLMAELNAAGLTKGHELDWPPSVDATEYPEWYDEPDGSRWAVLGREWGPDHDEHIWIAYPHEMCVGQTELIHELTHVVLHRVTGNGDGRHENMPWWDASLRARAAWRLVECTK